MQVAFPDNVRIRNFRARIEGLRIGSFTNIDGEPFARPSLNGFWRVNMTLLSHDEDSHLALTAFLAALQGNATTVLPMVTQWLPNGANGRKLAISRPAPVFSTDHAGFASEPFGGFALIAPAQHRDSFIDVSCPEMSRLRPGHRITLGDRMHQVIKVHAINESETASRVSLSPPVRGNFNAGEVVVVDQIKLKARLESADDVEDWNIPYADVKATFIEAF